ncbi:hypothetical protein D3C71_2141240 [compost metagenome]
MVEDHKKLGEVIVSLLQIHNGESKEKVVESWDGSTSVVVGKALEGYTLDKRDDGGVKVF